MTSSQTSLLVDAISLARPKHDGYLRAALGDLTDSEMHEMEQYLQYMIEQGENTESFCNAYCALLDQTLEEQLYFQRHLKYRYSRFSEVADQVYYDEAFMHDYMVGLAVSLYLWPSHRAIHRFFCDRLPYERKGSYLEIGPGHGNFLRQAMQDTAFERFDGVDVSPTSIRLTRQIMESTLPEKMSQLELVLGDFLSSELPRSTYDAIVSGEVLEHVEDPCSFLRRITELAKPEGFIFVTTCINAPEIDHIYLYRNESEVLDQFAECGLEVVKGLTVPHHGHSLEQCVKWNLPINVAYELRKAN